MNVFEAVKQSVTTRQAAERYGIKVNRNGMCVCPFHNDRNPSMKVDRRFYCFGCGATGDIQERAALITGHGKEVRNLERRMAELTAGNAAGSKEHGRNRRADPEH